MSKFIGENIISIKYTLLSLIDDRMEIMMKRIILFILLILLSQPIISSSSYHQREHTIHGIIDIEESDTFDNLIQRIMDHSHFPSVSACIIIKDHVVWSKAYGLSNIEQDYMATNKTIYGICSMTKTITGTALMQLYDQGLFDLDDDVNKYLPFCLRNPNFPDDPITFRMLLSHSSSLRSPPSYWNIRFYEHGGPPYQDYPSPWLEESLTPEGSSYDAAYWDDEEHPGTLGVYANINFDIIGYLIEILSNQPYYQYCEEHLFKPLEMYDTSFNLSRYAPEELANPYHWNDEQKKYEKNLNQVHLHYPAGGLFSSVSDMSHFMIAHMNGGMYNDTRILEEATVEEMHRIQSTGPGGRLAYGLAWLFESRSIKIASSSIYLPTLIYAGHGGAITSGLHTIMQMKQSEDVAILFFINSNSFLCQSGWNGIQLLRELFFLKAQSISLDQSM